MVVNMYRYTKKTVYYYLIKLYGHCATQVVVSDLTYTIVSVNIVFMDYKKVNNQDKDSKEVYRLGNSQL